VKESPPSIIVTSNSNWSFKGMRKGFVMLKGRYYHSKDPN
jgi:hypothetical protein